jgi:hypothetical protein
MPDSSSGSGVSQNRPRSSSSRSVPARLGKPSNVPRVGKLSGLLGTAGGMSGYKGITQGDIWQKLYNLFRR